MNSKISIFLPAFKSKDLLLKVFFPSLAENTFISYEVIIYDNGGNDFFRKKVDGFPNYEFIDVDCYYKGIIIGDEINVGLHKAYNECYKISTGDWIYLPHTDMCLLADWDFGLFSCFRNNVPSTVLACSRSIEPILGHTRHHKILDFGNNVSNFTYNRLNKWHEEEYMKDKEFKRIEVGARMPFMIHRSLLEKMQKFNIDNNISNGPFDEHYHSYCQDDDIVQTCWHLGVRKFYMSWGSLVYHLQSQSNSQQNIDRDSEIPYRYFVKKWSKWYRDVEHPGQWHPKIIPFYTTVK